MELLQLGLEVLSVVHVFYPRKSALIPCVVLLLVSAFFIWLQVEDFTGQRGILAPRVVYAAWLIVSIASFVGVLVWTIHTCWPWKPWFEIDGNGIMDRTPFGLGKVGWEEVAGTVTWGSGILKERQLGFLLKDTKGVLARQSWPVRTFLRFEWFVRGEPLLRVQERGIRNGIEPILREAEKYAGRARPKADTSTSLRCSILMMSGIAFCGLALWSMEREWGILSGLTLALGYVLLLGGILGFSIAAGKGSRLGTLVGLWFLSAITLFGCLAVALRA
jgi:hypothetical protein